MRPGDWLYIKSPSELSTFGAFVDDGSGDADDLLGQRFTSFWDDPTHQRPYPPGALYRLTLSTGVMPIYIRRLMAGNIHASTMLARVAHAGKRSTRYVTLKDVPRGLGSAFRHVWPDLAVEPQDEILFLAASRT